MLDRLAASRWRPLRLWAARKAAARALHVPALRGAADDPYVLARLGLFPLALEGRGNDAAADLGRVMAHAALGEDVAAAVAAVRDRGSAERRLIASALAPHGPEAALELLPDDAHGARAACLLAAGRPEEAARHAGLEGREGEAIRAHAAVRAERHGVARRALNAMFGADGLAPPLDEIEAPFTVDDLASRTGTATGGPTVSVIVPVHDAAATLEATVRSLLGQSWRDIEILLVDDRSTDGSGDLARSLAARDGRVRVLANRRAPGAYGARNTGIDAATGEFVAFLDSDDWSPAERIARQAALLSGAAIATANHIRMDEQGAPVAPRVFPLVRPVPITLMARREALLAAGPFEETATGADSEMLARLELRHGKRAVRRDPAVLLVARWRTGSLSESREGGLFGMERYAYRAAWMFRHAGLADPRLPVPPDAA